MYIYIYIFKCIYIYIHCEATVFSVVSCALVGALGTKSTQSPMWGQLLWLHIGPCVDSDTKALASQASRMLFFLIEIHYFTVYQTLFHIISNIDIFSNNTLDIECTLVSFVHEAVQQGLLLAAGFFLDFFKYAATTNITKVPGYT